MSIMDILSFACPDLAPQIRIIKDERGEPRFIAADICGAIDITNVSSACQKLPVEDKAITLVDTPSGKQDMLTVTEAGMYWLVIRSDKPAARPFIYWITHKVLPELRRTGQYTLNGSHKPTRWGWQPLREVAKAQGFTARDFVESANALDLPGVPTFTDRNYAAWSYGGCLPAESLVTRAEKLLDVPREKLFTPEVLYHYKNRGVGKRHRRTPAEIGN